MVTMKTPESVPVEQVGITAEDVQQQSTANQTSAAEQNDEINEQVDFSDEEAMLAAESDDVSLGEAAEGEDDSVSAATYAGKSKAELVELLAEKVHNEPVQSLRGTIEAIKIAFYKAHKAEIEALRREAVEAGADPDNLNLPTDTNEVALKALIAEYRTKRDEYMAGQEQTKEENLKTKLAIIEELKALINSNETMNQTFAAFRELQQRWKDAGPVPQANMKDLWDTYNHHVENFYEYIKINKELRDMDLKRNYEAKLALCEQAEALILEPSVVTAFHSLQKLHDDWREIGPVATEYKESLWERFKEASSRINKSHQQHFEKIKEEQQQNLELKTKLCEQTEELNNTPCESRKEWNKASETLLEIQKVWKTIGFAPKKENARIYERFRNACDVFFERKRTYYSGLKDQMEENLALKTQICEQAEAIMTSDDWKTTGERLIDLQRRWKEIGAVPRRQSDAVWKRFRAACDTFFERKAAHFSSVDSEHKDNLSRKRALLEEMAAFDITGVSFDIIKDFQRRWGEIGFVPIKQKEAIQKQYKEIVDKLFGALRGNERERNFDKFRNRISTLKQSGDKRLRYERERLYNKVKQLEADIATLENNIGFFAGSKNAESLIAEVRIKITKAKEEMADAIKKVQAIDAEDKQQD
ncbi:MAG: DUF349 domain-containing protein [Rikenellaceae bacterium]|nr:DUF349 domain-containing protein [Rikenellaceae bacterium]